MTFVFGEPQSYGAHMGWGGGWGDCFMSLPFLPHRRDTEKDWEVYSVVSMIDNGICEPSLNFTSFS